MLWITFKIFIFAVGNSKPQVQYQNAIVVNYFQNFYLCSRKQCFTAIFDKTTVVNYFQNFYLCSRKQLQNLLYLRLLCCELLSKFLSLQSETVVLQVEYFVSVLWITFKIFIFAVGNSWNSNPLRSINVVNYFQNFYLCSRKQFISINKERFISCELLSKFLSLQSETVT